jgi:hypothetical protein
MDQPLMWLPDVNGTAWKPLAEAARRGLPVPAGFIALRSSEETDVRRAYEKIKLHERTHFVAVRGATHAILNVIGPDRLVHTLRRLWSESPEAAVLVQRMVHSMWCGKVQSDGNNLRITANQGMMVLDPDMYVVERKSGTCTHRNLAPRQRKMIRHVDGSAKVVAWEGERVPMPEEYISKIVELDLKANSDIGWAIDDLEKIWLI